MATIIVSPTARAKANNLAAAIPLRAAGKMTRKIVEARPAPKAYAPSRKSLETALSASSDKEAIIGVIMNPMTMPGLRALKPDKLGKNSCSSGVTKRRAK